MKYSDLPKHITFQWHITDKCNLRCQHCYQDSYDVNGVSSEQQLEILNELHSFVETAKSEHTHVSSHINFTGGEPFLRDDFLELLKAARKKDIFSIGILSNGFLLPKNKLDILANLKLSFIQLSMEGSTATNDKIRGAGSTQQIIEAIAAYRKLNIPTVLSFTANAENYAELPKVASFGRKHKVNKVWTDRYLPHQLNDPLRMTSQQSYHFFEILANEKRKNRYHFFSKTQISAHRALQFLQAGGKPYRCTAGKNLLAIMPNGDIYPCRRLPIHTGNALTDDIIELYLNNKTLNELRQTNTINDDCSSCYYKTACNGGLKCLSHIVKGDFKAKDPDCWL